MKNAGTEGSVPAMVRSFLVSLLPAFLRGSGAIVDEAGLFGCGYAALGAMTIVIFRLVMHREGGSFHSSLWRNLLSASA